MKRWLVLIALWLGALGLPALAAGERVALVIGNGDYQNVGTLTNPVNDATDFAAALRRVGFEVTLATDLDFEGMRKALQGFSKAATGADMAFIYYAGHGVEIDNQNFLIPIDATLESDRDVPLQTISLDLVTQMVEGAKSLRMVVLDACRNNPFLSRMVRTSANRSIGRGLGGVEPTGATLVAYSAKGGTVASDGNGRNSPFMKALLDNVEKPGLDVSLMFRKVRDAVLVATNNEQEPFVYGSLPGNEIYLVPPTEVATAPTEPKAETPVATTPAQPRNTDAEELTWKLVKKSRDPDDLRNFVQTYKDGVHHDEAVAMLVEVLSAPKVVEVPATPTAPVAPPEEPVPDLPVCRVADVRPPDAWLALRSQPSDKAGRQLRKLLPGESFTMQPKRSGSWHFVTLPNGQEGWVSWQVARWIKC